MSWRAALGTLVVLLTVAVGGFLLFERQLSGTWLAFGTHPEVMSVIDQSLADQKRLAELDPVARLDYRRQFEAVDTLRKRLLVVEHNRQSIIRRFQMVLFASFAAVLSAAVTGYLWQQRRNVRRLERLRQALEALVGGQAEVRVGNLGRDAIGRVGAMIESTSKLVAAHRRRLQALENLSAWQEAARRHAHEMKTPLTAARLELTRLSQVASGMGESGGAVGELAGSLGQEIERLAIFTRRFTSFARLPQPRPVRQSLAKLVNEFVTTFREAWPSLSLELLPPEGDFEVLVDGEMLRQVLVNLCDNTAHAVGERGGRVILALRRDVAGAELTVADNGPGVAPEVRRRIFEPYATTKKVGEGMGLGLAISKKILLDHGGDLELASTGETGTVFRLTFPWPSHDGQPVLAAV